MRSRWLGIAAALVAAIVSLALWRKLPPEVVVNWSLRGEPGETYSRTWVALAGPAMILGLWLLFQILPRLDPRRENYARFHDTSWLILNGLLLCVLVLDVAVLASGAGSLVSVERVGAGCFAVLLLVLGNSLGRVRPNWILGVRTPWTLDHPDVWRRTHRVAAWLFVAAGIVSGVAALLPRANPFDTSLVAVLMAALLSIVLSLVFWFQERRS